MKLSTRTFTLICLIAILVVLSAITATSRNWLSRSRQADRRGDQVTSLRHQATKINRKNWRKMGGIDRPPVDFAKQSQPIPENSASPFSKAGFSPKLPVNLNANTRSIAEAASTGKFPERLSVMVEPPKFNKKEFSKSPQKYLDVVQPGRVFQVLPKGPDVKPIGEVGEQYFELIQGEMAVLKAKADPGMPVTFYSGRLGQFENGLTSQTLLADENGVATAKFKASTGTHGDIDIIAGSPTRSGNARYLVKVILPAK